MMSDMIDFVINKDKIRVIGGAKLSGSIRVQGAKNEALQVICATLLTEDEVTINRVPKILDVLNLIETLEFLGVEISDLGQGSYRFSAKNIDLKKINSKDCRDRVSKSRGALLITGAMLGRFGIAAMSKPGGDNIGIRPVDTHLNGFESLGAKISDKDENYREIKLEKLDSKDFYLQEISVTGTANVILASVLSKGAPAKITIRNAACEPYIVGLCNLLNAMGAKISGISSNTLVIETVDRLSGATHTLMPDFVEAGSLIGLAAVTRSDVKITGVSLSDLGFMIPLTFEILGVILEEDSDGIKISSKSDFKIKKLRDGHVREIYDAPWPGLTPDLLSIIVVVASHAEGVLKVHQKMFEKRLFFVDRLQEMGAEIEICDPHRVIIIGQNHKSDLRGIKMASPDIRAGMALFIAALSAKGESIIDNATQIHRGYENIFERLEAIGADIEYL